MSPIDIPGVRRYRSSSSTIHRQFKGHLARIAHGHLLGRLGLGQRRWWCLVFVFGRLDQILPHHAAAFFLVLDICAGRLVGIAAHDIVRAPVTMATAADGCGCEADEQAAQRLPGCNQLVDALQASLFFLREFHVFASMQNIISHSSAVHDILSRHTGRSLALKDEN